MTPRLSRAVVRLSAWLAPRHLRDRWREEWLGEIQAGADRRTSRVTLLRRSLGAPRDAWAMRRLAAAPATARLGQWWTDIRHTVRLLARSPGYVATVVLGLGVGLTATIAMFSTANAILHGDVPGIADRDSLARVEVLIPSAGAGSPLRVVGSPTTPLREAFASTADFPLLRRNRALIADAAAESLIQLTVHVGTETESVWGSFASDTFFQMLGTRPVIGRLLTADDDRPDASVVVIGYRLWQSRFGGRLDAVGQTIVVGDRLMRIVGVAPDQFRGLSPTWIVEAWSSITPQQVWLPLALARNWTGTPISGNWLTVVVRLAPGVTRAQAKSEIAGYVRALHGADSPAAHTNSVRVMDFVLGDLADDALGLTGFVALLLVLPVALLAIACANVANLRLARATARTAELAVRISLGATPGQLMRLLLIEATMVTGLALFLGGIGAQALIGRLAPRFLYLPVRIDWRVVLFSIVVAGGVIVLSGLAPAWLVTRRATVHGLRQTAQAGGLAHSKLRHGLVVGQIAISLVLLSLGSLFTRSLQVVNQSRPATLDGLIVATLDLKSQAYTPARATAFASTLLTRLEADARFSGVGLAESDLFVPPPVLITTPGDAADVRRRARTNRVTPGWFGAMALPARLGRTFSSTDRDDVVVINEAAARAIAPGGSAIGLPVTLHYMYPEERSVTATVIGVVPDALRDTDRPLEPLPFVYVPLYDPMPLRLTLLARADRPAERASDLSLAIASVDPMMPWTRIQLASGMFDDRVIPTRTLALGVNVLGAAALALAAAGLFAVMAYAVSLRTREIGIRMALGAHASQVTALVLRQALRLSAFGALAGFAITLPLMLITRQIFLGVSPFDPLAILPVALLLVATAIGAGVLPARRAASVDPVKALRAE
jgi:predicted permease